MNSLDLKVFLERDEDYGGHVVRCPSIQGCYSQGKTIEQAMVNISEAINLCIEESATNCQLEPLDGNI